jgi:hypothetical protein
MIEKALIFAWIYLFFVVCEKISKQYRQRSRECRHEQARALRRFTRGNEYSRSSNRRRTADLQPAS